MAKHQSVKHYCNVVLKVLVMAAYIFFVTASEAVPTRGAKLYKGKREILNIFLVYLSTANKKVPITTLVSPGICKFFIQYSSHFAFLYHDYILLVCVFYRIVKYFQLNANQEKCLNPMNIE